MKRFLWVALALLGLVAAGIAIAVTQIDPQKISAFAADQASAALGRRVEVGDVHLGFFPPGIRLREVSVAGAPGEPQLAKIAGIDLGVALLPLVHGAVELSSLTIDAPQLALPLGPDGFPRAPTLPGAETPAPGKSRPGRTPRTPAPPPPPPPAEPSSKSGAVALSIKNFRIEKGELTSGPWRVRELEVKGRLDSLTRAKASVSAQLEGVGRIAISEVAADGLGEDDLRLRAAGSLESVDLAALLKLLPAKLRPLELGSGRVDGPFSLELRQSELAAARTSLSFEDLDVKSGGAELRGPAKLDVALGERFAIDLDGAEIAVPGVLRKPGGQRLSVSGPLGATLGPAAVTSAELNLGTARIPLTLELAAKPQRVELGRTELDLAALAGWLESPPGKVGGRIRSEGLRVGLSPLSIDGALQLDAASLAVNGIDLGVSGAVQAQGTKLAGQGLVVSVGDQRFSVSGSYVLEPSTVDVSLLAENVDVEKLVTAIRGKSELVGTLNAKFQVHGPPDPTKLAGGGEFEIKDGRIRGFSLVKQFLGQFADIGMAVAQARGHDLSRYEEEEFQRLGGRFTLEPGRANVESMRIDYRYGSAELSGPITIPDGELALRGQLTLRREVSQDLSGQTDAQEQVIPIEGVGGTVSSPRLRIDRQTLVALATRMAAGGRLGKQLDDKLEKRMGKEGADAIRGLLDSVLGGGRRRPDQDPNAPQGQPESAPAQPAQPPTPEKPAEPPGSSPR